MNKHKIVIKMTHSLPVGVGDFLRQENLVFASVAAILDNTRCGGAGRAVVDKMAKPGEGAGGAKRNAVFPFPPPPPLLIFALALSYPGARASKIQDGARLANGLR